MEIKYGGRQSGRRYLYLSSIVTSLENGQTPFITKPENIERLTSELKNLGTNILVSEKKDGYVLSIA